MKWYQFIFSIKNINECNKIITIIGFKFKIKRILKKIQNDEYIQKVFSKTPNNKINLDCMDIAFIIPAPIKGSGGFRNICRAIKYLKDFGHKITVYYMQTSEPADVVKKNVSNWFYDMSDIPFIHYEGKLGYHDIGIATWWETAYILKRHLDKIKKSFYMVQDFEPWFSPMSSGYILAENTYKFGFHHICSGPWCKDFLVKKYNAIADYFQFPVDINIYNKNKPRTKKNKNIIFFAKPEMPRRCYEIGIKALEEFHKLKPNVEIILFGSNNINPQLIPFKATVLKLLPTINDLANLYRNADIGIVFSTTNPSLVPYEMLACGCPVADLELDLALAKYGNDENNVFLFSPEPEVFAKQLSNLIDKNDLLRNKAEHGCNWVSREFPTELEMAKIYEKIIKENI